MSLKPILKPIQSDKAPKAIGPYSQAMQAGQFVFCSGQIPIDPASGEMVEGIEAQTRQCITNMRAVLEAAGLGLEQVIKTTVFLKDMNEFSKMNAMYEEGFGAHKPARAAVEVARLPKDCLVEIECVAYTG